MANDPFAVFGAPKGLVYQWRAIDGDIWNSNFGVPVPADRHPTLPSVEGRITVGGLTLMEVPESWISEAQDEAGAMSASLIAHTLDKMRKLAGEIGGAPESVTVTIKTTYEPFYPEDYGLEETTYVD